ncbi:GtrA family protein [Phenylobacterium sp.]|uniref:GtrA family protein n=1 Tax=Phenylobacterium sp. TaxID=1871053 RepID=UPI00286D60D5|nr:GtrA family protein [Phenylobacterium sp.]
MKSAAGLASWRPSAELIGLLSRFGLVGLANTALGFGVIAALDIGLGVNRQVANALGYGAGMVLSFILNRTFVFHSRDRPRATAPKFVASLLIAFCLNQAVLFAVSQVLGGSTPERLAAQLVAMASYTGAFFLLCRLWVFRSARETTVDRVP